MYFILNTRQTLQPCNKANANVTQEKQLETHWILTERREGVKLGVNAREGIVGRGGAPAAEGVEGGLSEKRPRKT